MQDEHENLPTCQFPAKTIYIKEELVIIYRHTPPDKLYNRLSKCTHFSMLYTLYEWVGWGSVHSCMTSFLEAHAALPRYGKQYIVTIVTCDGRRQGESVCWGWFMVARALTPWETRRWIWCLLFRCVLCFQVDHKLLNFEIDWMYTLTS